MLPFVSMTAGIWVADRSGLHRVVVEHDVVKCTVLAADKHMSLTSVQLRMVPDGWGLSSSLSAVILGTTALRCAYGLISIRWILPVPPLFRV